MEEAPTTTAGKFRTCSAKHEDAVFAYCRTDNVYVCEQCYESHHRGHVVDYLKFVARDNLNALRTLEAKITDSINMCSESLRSYSGPQLLRTISDTVSAYYDSLISELKLSCARKIGELQSALGPQTAGLDRTARTVEQHKDELSGLLARTRQQAKTCENSLVANKFRHLCSEGGRLAELLRKVEVSCKTIEADTNAMRRSFALVTFDRSVKSVCARVEEGISTEPEEVAEEQAVHHPTTYEGQTQSPLKRDSDTIRFFKALNEGKGKRGSKQKEPGEKRENSRTPKGKRARIHNRSLTPDCGRMKTPPRGERPRPKPKVRTTLRKPARTASTHDNEHRIFYIEPAGKLLHIFYPTSQETRVVQLISAQPFPEGFGAAEMQNGQIIMTGGERNKQITNAVYEIYESVKNVIERRHMIYARHNHVLLSVQDRAVAIGGYNRGSTALKKCERFDLENNMWTELPELNEERNFLSACAVGDRFIYVFGGTQLAERDRAETYETLDTEQPSSWTLLQISTSEGPCQSVIRFGVGSVQMSKSEILIFGGLNENQYFNASYILNTETGILANTGSVLKVKDAFYQRQPAVAGNSIFCFGYWSKCVHCFNIETFEWTATLLS